MRNVNERPICHRGEDLVSYLYGEANESEGRDFAEHMRLCDACRSEFVIFRQVHESILEWRSEALGAVSASPIATAQVPATGSARAVRLPALAAIREFFSVSPLWLRGATALATVLFCLLAGLAVVRLWQRPTDVASGAGSKKLYTQAQLDDAVKQKVDEIKKDPNQPSNASSSVTQISNSKSVAEKAGPKHGPGRQQLAATRLTRQERKQLLADLGLAPGYDDDDLPFVLPDEPNQDKDD